MKIFFDLPNRLSKRNSILFKKKSSSTLDTLAKSFKKLTITQTRFLLAQSFSQIVFTKRFLKNCPNDYISHLSRLCPLKRQENIMSTHLQVLNGPYRYQYYHASIILFFNSSILLILLCLVLWLALLFLLSVLFLSSIFSSQRFPLRKKIK